MPTENRSSNTEMVSVPREHELKIRQTPLADLLSGLKTGEIRDCSDREFAVGDTVLLREIDGALDYTGTVTRRTITHVQKNFGLPDHLCVLSYAQPAEQHQGEPVALPARKHAIHADYSQNPLADGWNACLDEIAKLGPLYTHADPGEVERLTEQLEVANQAIAYAAQQAEEKKKVTDALMADAKQFRGERDTLRTQLAERDALLRDLLNCNTGFKMRQRIEAALSASAEPSAPKCKYCEGRGQVCIDWEVGAWEDCPHCAPVNQSLVECDACPRSGGCVNTCMKTKPSAPVERDERAEFESYAVTSAWLGLGHEEEMARDGEGYAETEVHTAWDAWQARAALERKP